jgi:hypothetical protein
MTKTKERPRTPQTVEAELEEVRTRLAEMRSELAELSQAPEISWDASEDEMGQLADDERRRFVLPHQIRAGELREKELELELTQLRLPEIEPRTTQAYDVVLAKKRKLEAAEAEFKAADGEWNDLLRLGRELKADAHRLSKEVEGLKSKARRDAVALSAPVVRSLWQTGR